MTRAQAQSKLEAIFRSPIRLSNLQVLDDSLLFDVQCTTESLRGSELEALQREFACDASQIKFWPVNDKYIRIRLDVEELTPVDLPRGSFPRAVTRPR